MLMVSREGYKQPITDNILCLAAKKTGKPVVLEEFGVTLSSKSNSVLRCYKCVRLHTGS